MNVSLLKLINLVIILIMLGFLSKYAWSLFFDGSYEPAEWEYARKRRLISPALLKAMKQYEDKVRFFTFWLQIERLKKENVAGSFAELGVYKGETARLIHLMDKSRILHLFDTFDGLPEKDLMIEKGEAATYSNINFKDTSVDKVMEFVGRDAKKICIHAGYFPETTIGLENECYAFVSMDADLYNPTLAGLNYFYSRLSPGGVIVIHDYTYKWEGLQKAVDEFSALVPESLVCIPDLEGSVMIVKSSGKA
jgi:O-methyltransferase